MAWYTGSSTSGMLRAAWVCEVSHCNPCSGGGGGPPIPTSGKAPGAIQPQPTAGCIHFQSSNQVYPYGDSVRTFITNNVPYAALTAPPIDCGPIIQMDHYGNATGPILQFFKNASTGTIPYSWTWSLTYDGVSLQTAAGSGSLPPAAGEVDFQISSGGAGAWWTGTYNSGSQLWTYNYEGWPSASLNPEVTETLTISFTGAVTWSASDAYNFVSFSENT